MRDYVADSYHQKLLESQAGDAEKWIMLSVVAPCYNEDGNIDTLYRRVADVCRDVVGDAFEIVLVNDGSSDQTWAKISDAAEKTGKVTAVNLSRNFGHQSALTAGLFIARGDYILVIDADLQDPPELLGEMLAKMQAGADVVYGQRAKRAGDATWRKMASGIFYRLLTKLSDIDIPLDAGDFRMISRRVRDVLLTMPENDRYIRGMISWIGFKQEPVIYDRDVRTAGTTSYSIKRLLIFALDGITGFSIRPLRLSMFIGTATAALSFIYMIYIVIKGTMSGVPVLGWPSLMATVLFLGGVQMIFLGLIGEYLGRLFLQSKNRPSFVIESIRYADVDAKGSAKNIK